MEGKKSLSVVPLTVMGIEEKPKHPSEALAGKGFESACACVCVCVFDTSPFIH